MSIRSSTALHLVHTKCVCGFVLPSKRSRPPTVPTEMTTEKLLTHADQHAVSEMDVILNGEGSRTRVISRSVAKEASTQVFYPRVQGNAPCFGHVSCDAIIMGTAKVRAIPEISCNHVDAGLIHEAAIGRIAGEQLLKLETLGLSPEEAEEKILEGFLR